MIIRERKEKDSGQRYEKTNTDDTEAVNFPKNKGEVLTVKVMYFSYQPYFLDLAREMEKNDWEPVYWSVVPGIEDKVKSEYPNVICHMHYDAVKGIPPAEYTDKKLDPLCPLLLEKMAVYERNALRMLERNDSHTNTFSYRERVSLYKYLVQYWSTVLGDLRPQHVVFEVVQHHPNGYWNPLVDAVGPRASGPRF